ncbi:MAG: DUF1571 domain-containing protein [Planctomycetota bacterium]
MARIGITTAIAFLAWGIFSATSVAQDTKDEMERTVEGDHPLSAALKFAESRSEYIQKNIRDYSARLIKRERIDGKLQNYQFINVKMRCEQTRDGEVIPMAVFMQYLAPKSLRDRRVLYVEGENNGRILVRKGGVSLQHVKLRIDPTSAGARRESNYPITDVGFDKVIRRLIERLVEDMEKDPSGENTKVTSFRGAQVGQRDCTRIQVVHPKPLGGVDYHQANLFVDDELKLPIRLTVHDWPEKEGQELPLIEEYTYVDLKVNVGLEDSEFSAKKLESKSDESAKTASND